MVYGHMFKRDDRSKADRAAAVADCNVSVAEMKAELDAIAAVRGIVWSGAEIGPSAVEAERTRYATPGTRTGRGIVRLVSPAQVGFIKRLLAERDTTKLVRLPGSENIESMSLAGARDLIERLLACPMRADVPAQVTGERATDAQVAYLRKLYAERVRPEGFTLPHPDTITKREAHAAIDALKSAPVKPREATAEPTELDAGIYLCDGTVFKVQRAVHGSGRMYAKALSKDTGKFEYASGAIKRLTADMRMTLEQAKEYGAVYGVCCNCGRTLTDENSIEAGIGPVCASKF